MKRMDNKFFDDNSTKLWFEKFWVDTNMISTYGGRTDMGGLWYRSESKYGFYERLLQIYTTVRILNIWKNDSL